MEEECWEVPGYSVLEIEHCYDPLKQPLNLVADSIATLERNENILFLI